MPPAPLAYLNGRFLPRAELALAPHDAGFVFGATVTDFCRTYRHRLFRWADHLARLRRDCHTCYVPLEATDGELTAAAEHLVEANAKLIAPDDDMAVVTFVTPGPLAYMAEEDTDGPPTVAMHTFPIPTARYRRFYTEGAALAYAGPAPLDIRRTGLTGAKNRSRMHWWMAGRRFAATIPGAVPVLFHLGQPDTAVGAVLAVRDGMVYRPEPNAVLLPSISADVLEEVCAAAGVPVVLRPEWKSHHFVEDSELLLCGSAFGVAGVRRWAMADETTDYPWPGPVYSKLVAAWSDMVGVDIARQMTG